MVTKSYRFTFGDNVPDNEKLLKILSSYFPENLLNDETIECLKKDILLLNSNKTESKDEWIDKLLNEQKIAVRHISEKLDDSKDQPGREYLNALSNINNSLKNELLLRRRSDVIQGVMYDISNSVYETLGIHELYKRIRGILSRAIDTTNFFIAYYNRDTDELLLPFFVDKADSFERVPAEKTMTGLVIKRAEPLFVDEEGIEKLEKQGLIDLIGTPCKVWLGVPLIAEERIIGAMVVQNYDDESALTYDDLEMLSFVSANIGNSIERKMAQEELVESEKRFKVLAESITDILYGLDENMAFTYANQAAEAFFGMDINKYPGRKMLVKNLSEEKDELFEAHKVALESGRAMSVSIDFGERNGKKYYEFNIYPSAGGISVFAKDVTPGKEAEYAIKKYSRELEELNRAKDKFFSILAHDLKTPFNSLLGLSELLIREADDFSKSEMLEIISSINNSAHNVFNLVKNLLDWSRIQTGRIDFRKENVQLSKMVYDLIDLYKQSAADKSIQLNERIPENLCVSADRYMLETVLRNLISNAIKFTPEFGKVNISGKLSDKKILLTVVDTGIGIDPRDIKKLFNIGEQFTTPGTCSEAGTGLGLILCKEFIEKNNGKIRVESIPGKGSKFLITLPFKNDRI